MEIPLRHLERLFAKTQIQKVFFDLTDLSQANAYSMQASGIDFQPHLDKAYLDKLKAKGVQKVSICANRDVMAHLRQLFPSEYVQPQFEDNLPNLQKRLELIEKMNKVSKKRRELLLKEEIIARDTQERERVFLKSDTPINDLFFKKIATRPDAAERIQVSYNEEGILVFVSNPVENVKLRIDIAALVSMSNFPVTIQETSSQAIDAFLTKRPRLVVLTQLEKAWESKEVFLGCYKHDPFFHYLVYNESPSGKREEELNRILSLYNDDYQTKYDAFTMDKARNKPILDNEQKAPILARIEQLRQNFNRKNFIEMQFYLYRLGTRFNVTTLENILSKITVTG
ncbi:MAG: hypothetical protein J0L75_02390 [Spirochaetes bacterium]|nr:hypothetical protein [Spirochaetota bacterium]